VLLATSAGPALFAGAVFLVLLCVFAALLGVWIWGLVDAAKRPEWAYVDAGANKTLWVVLVAVLGWVLAIVYLAAIRPGVRAAEERGPRYGYGPYAQGAWMPPPPGPGTPPPSWQPGPGGGAAPRACAACGSPSHAADGFCRACGARLS